MRIDFTQPLLFCHVLYFSLYKGKKKREKNGSFIYQGRAVHIQRYPFYHCLRVLQKTNHFPVEESAKNPEFNNANHKTSLNDLISVISMKVCE